MEHSVGLHRFEAESAPRFRARNEARKVALVSGPRRVAGGSSGRGALARISFGSRAGLEVSIGWPGFLRGRLWLGPLWAYVDIQFVIRLRIRLFALLCRAESYSVL